MKVVINDGVKEGIGMLVAPDFDPKFFDKGEPILDFGEFTLQGPNIATGFEDNENVSNLSERNVDSGDFDGLLGGKVFELRADSGSGGGDNIAFAFGTLFLS